MMRLRSRSQDFRSEWMGTDISTAFRRVRRRTRRQSVVGPYVYPRERHICLGRRGRARIDGQSAARASVRSILGGPQPLVLQSDFKRNRQEEAVAAARKAVQSSRVSVFGARRLLAESLAKLGRLDESKKLPQQLDLQQGYRLSQHFAAVGCARKRAPLWERRYAQPEAPNNVTDCFIARGTYLMALFRHSRLVRDLVPCWEGAHIDLQPTPGTARERHRPPIRARRRTLSPVEASLRRDRTSLPRRLHPGRTDKVQALFTNTSTRPCIHVRWFDYTGCRAP